MSSSPSSKTCTWPTPQDRPPIYETIALEKKLLKLYKENFKKKPPPTPLSQASLIRQRYWNYDPGIGIALDDGKYDVVAGHKNQQIKVNRIPLSRKKRKKRSLPPRCNGLIAPPKFIEISTKYMKWKQIQIRIARERKMNIDNKFRTFEREWVLDERNPNEKFRVAIPPATPLDRVIHNASTKLCRFWRACCARSFGKRFKASRIIQRTARVYIAKTFAKRIKIRREDNEKKVKQMFQRRYSITFNKWYKAAHKEKQIKRFGATLNGAFSENWIRACFDSLQQNSILEKKAALN